MTDNQTQGVRITIYFPEEYELSPFDCRGALPVKGQHIYVRSPALQVEKRFNYQLDNNKMKKFLRCWKVIDVYYSVMSFKDTRELVQSENSPEMRVEVIVTPIWFKRSWFKRLKRWMKGN